MKYPKNSFYNWQKFPPKTLALRSKLSREILYDFLITFDTFHHMNNVINTANKNNDDFWSVESNYIGLNKLFTLGMIENEDHKQTLLNLAYDMASAEIGNKNFENRAERIAQAMRMRILSLAKSGVSV